MREVGMERVAVYTCITNSYDQLRAPPDWPGCDFICFTDNPYLRSKSWEIRVLPDEPLDAARKSRLPKILPHRFLLEYSISVWMDANVTFNCDVAALARRSLTDQPALFFRHPERSCVFAEAAMCIKLKKDEAAILERQAAEYREIGLPAESGLYECTVIMRRHRNPAVIELMEHWWREVMARSRRDQVSLPFVVWRSQFPLQTITNSVADSKKPIFERARHFVQRRVGQKRGAIKRSEIAVLSFPKSGRTWLRQFLVDYQHAKGDRKENIEFGPGSLGGRGIVFDHEYMEFFQDCADPARLMYPNLLAKKRVVLLVRDPRAVIVSYYYHKRLRDRIPVGGLYDFAFSAFHGIERQSDFVNQLLDFYEAKRGDKLLLRYEELRRRPAEEFKHFLDFVFPGAGDQSSFEHALAASSFEQMQSREIELSKTGNNPGVARTRTRSWNGDTNALELRKGDLNEAREFFWPQLWREISALPNTRRLLKRLDYLEPAVD